MKRILSIISLLLLTEMGYAQDPGIRDTVRFGNWGVYLPCPPCSGIATVPIFVYHDETLGAMEFYLTWTGPIEISKAEFSSEIDSVFGLPYIGIDTADNIAGILLPHPLEPSPLPLSPGSRNIGYLVLSVKDTGGASIDTFRPEAPPNPPITFWTPETEIVFPSFFPSQFHLVPQNIKPGDSNGDGSTSLVDIVYFVNYLFRGGPPPVNKQMADVNLDCAINLEDLIFLVNYIFKAGPKPLPSWCGDQPLPCPDTTVNGDLVEHYVDLGASWSPDGNSLVYYHVPVSTSDSFGLYIFDMVTSKVRYLSGAGRLAEYPDWSPNGDWIVFEKYGQIFKIKANGDSLTQLTFSGENFFPDWSPDGNRMAYHKIVPVDSSGIWFMDADGSNKKRVVGGEFPSFSPDGSKLLYVGLYEHLYTADTNGNNVVKIATLSGGLSTKHPSFSPQGDKIVFEYQLPGERPDTWVINSDGTNLVRLTTDGGYAPSWSPDGSKILYTNSCQYEGYLWIMNPDGSNKRQITFESLYKK